MAPSPWSNLSAGHLLEPADALLDRRMRREQPRNSRRAQRIDDKQMCRRRAGVHRHPLVGGLELAQRAGQVQRIMREVGPARIGLVLARARNRKLNEGRSDRREDARDQQPRQPAFLVVATAKSEDRTPSNHRADHHHGADETGESALAELVDLDAEVLHSYLSEVTGWICALAGDRPPLRIIDLGSGTGTGTFALLERFPAADAIALDLSAEMLRR